MSCNKIMLIRHSERPSPAHGRGVSLSGDKDDRSLTVRGWQRAGALARFFVPLGGAFAHPALATPEALFACKAGPKAQSLRPQHTLLPIAELLQIKLNCDYFEDDITALVEKASASPGPALISWKHDGLPKIANAILGNASTAPQSWPLSRVDVVWVFDRRSKGSDASGGGAWTFTQIPQLLLAGDSPDVIA